MQLAYHAQEDDTSCGPAALQMIFEHLGVAVRQEEFRRMLSTSSCGTAQQEIVCAVRANGFVCDVRENGSVSDLLCCMRSGYPPLVNYVNPLSEHGHYAIVTGFDEPARLLFLADPHNGNDYTLGWDEFQAAWHSGSGELRGWFMIVGREGIALSHCGI